MQLEPSRDYRTFLRNEYRRRSKANPRYSLRRFAQQLGVSPATVSGVLSGKRTLSMRKAASIAEQLNLDPMQSTFFLQTVAASQVPSNTTGGEYQKQAHSVTLDKVEMKRLEHDKYQVIADWYHAAIMELTYIPGAKLEPRWISQSLGCSYLEATDALERLQRLGLLELQDGKWTKTVPMLTSGTDFPSSAMRRHHLQMLARAKQSLLSDPIDKRDFTAMTMAIDPSKLPEAKKMITEFRRRLCAFLETGNRSALYEISIELFPLMRSKTK